MGLSCVTAEACGYFLQILPIHAWAEAYALEIDLFLDLNLQFLKHIFGEAWESGVSICEEVKNQFLVTVLLVIILA